MEPRLTHHTKPTQAELGLLWCSWPPAHFLSPVLLQRTSSTLPSVPQEENALEAQVHKSRETAKRLSLWIFYGLLTYMPLHIFLSTWLGTSFGVLEAAKIAKDVVLVIGFLFAFCTNIREPWFKTFLRDRLVWLIAAYALLTIGLALIKPTDTDAEILGVVYNLRFLLFFLYGLLLMRLFDAKHIQTVAIKIVLSVSLIVVVFGIVQYVALPNDALKHVGYARENGVLATFFIDNKPDLERVMSTIRDPNSLGSYLIIIGPLLAAIWLKRKNRRVGLAAFGLATVICLVLTFSRSAWLGFVLAAASFAALGDQFRHLVTKHKQAVITSVVILVLVALGGFLLFRNTYFVQNTVLHADKSTKLEDPNQLRVRFFRESIKEISAHPLGGGPGTAGLASIRNQVQGTHLNENYYLQIASEVGIAGLLLFVAIIGLVGRRLWHLHRANPYVTALLASFIGLGLTNFLVHIWSNEAVAYTWWGLAGICLISKPQTKRRS